MEEALDLSFDRLLMMMMMIYIKGQIEVTGTRGRRREKLLDDLKDRRGYCQLKEEALDLTMWRNRFGRVFGPVVLQITGDDDDDDDDDDMFRATVCPSSGVTYTKCRIDTVNSPDYVHMVTRIM